MGGRSWQRALLIGSRPWVEGEGGGRGEVKEAERRAWMAGGDAMPSHGVLGSRLLGRRGCGVADVVVSHGFGDRIDEAVEVTVACGRRAQPRL